MSVCSIDFETRSPVDLKKTGVYPYAAHPHTDLWCFAWAFDDEPTAIWHPTLPFPERLAAHVTAGGTLRAWNAQFERIIWRDILTPRYGAPLPTMAQWVCTMAEAAAMALPQGLDQCATALRLPFGKDQTGYGEMLRMARPRSLRPDGTPVWWDVPERKARLYAYCQQDVDVERAAAKCLRRLSEGERAVYLLDQTINDRGLRIDRPLIDACEALVAEGTRRADAAVHDITNGAVAGVHESKRFAEWVRGQGVEIAGVAKAAVRDAFADDTLPERVRVALVHRAEAGRSSVAKLTRMLQCAGADDRIRGLLRYHGASTGRWSGKLVQPQNFPRGEIENVEALIPLIQTGDYDAVESFAAPIPAVSSLLRACLIAAPGMTFTAGDFSAIEARVLNWFAGQHDMLGHFRAYDAGDKARDPYVQNAMRLYRLPFEAIQKYPHRQTGKFQELGCGYGMGAKKAVTAAKDVYGLEITPEQADEIVTGYRDSHAAVVTAWYATERACLAAVRSPGEVIPFGEHGRVKAVVAGAYLYLILPSKRTLCYAAPREVEAPTPWGEVKPTLEIAGVDPYSKQWGRIRLYGGLLVENIVQAISRDIMADRMLALEAAGYHNVLTVHDEVVTETAEDFGSEAEFAAILRTAPAWASDCPIAVECWRGPRYRK